MLLLLKLLFLDLNLSSHNDIVSTKIYDKRDDFNFDIVNFPFLDGDVPQRPSYGVYISQLIRFARASSHVTDFNYRNKGPRMKSYSICLDLKRLCLGPCIIKNCIFVLKLKPAIQST